MIGKLSDRRGWREVPEPWTDRLPHAPGVRRKPGRTNGKCARKAPATKRLPGRGAAYYQPCGRPGRPVTRSCSNRACEGRRAGWTRRHLPGDQIGIRTGRRNRDEDVVGCQGNWRSTAFDGLPTLLGAHAIPPEYSGRPDAYVDLVIEEMIPSAQGLATAVDVFTEKIAFDLPPDGTCFAGRTGGRIPGEGPCRTALLHGWRSAGGATGRIVGGSPGIPGFRGIAALADAGSVATLLPGAFYFLRETTSPPVAELKEAGVHDRDCVRLQSGSSPVMAPLLMANMACVLWGIVAR